MPLAKISGTDVTNPDDFQRLLHAVDLNHTSGSDQNVIKAMIIQNDTVSITYPYNFQCTSMDDTRYILQNLSEYCCYIRDSEAIKAIGNKRNEYSSKITSEQDQTEGKRQTADDMEIVDVPMTDRENAMSVENGTAANVASSNLMTSTRAICLLKSSRTWNQKFRYVT